jgi:uncharacterized membrane protein
MSRFVADSSTSAADRFRTEPPLRDFRRRRASGHGGQDRGINVGRSERAISVAAGSLLAAVGLARRDWAGLLIGGVGSAIAYRGVSGHCPVYERLEIDRSIEPAPDRDRGVHVSVSYLVNKRPAELYAFWRKLENLPQFMEHLKSVEALDDRRSRWVAKAPALYGGEASWEAEITSDEPNSRIAWQSLPGSDLVHSGSVTFAEALGDRGTIVRVRMEYEPPAGAVGRWMAKLFGEEPEQQIREDLRRFKRLMEVGEIITTEGQSRGSCTGGWLGGGA